MVRGRGWGGSSYQSSGHAGPGPSRGGEGGCSGWKAEPWEGRSWKPTLGRIGEISPSSMLLPAALSVNLRLTCKHYINSLISYTDICLLDHQYYKTGTGPVGMMCPKHQKVFVLSLLDRGVLGKLNLVGWTTLLVRNNNLSL